MATPSPKAGSATGIRTPEPIRAVHAPDENESSVKDTGIQTTVQSPGVSIPAQERFTSLIATPPTQATTSTPDSRASSPEPWDQYKAERARRKLLRHEAESATKLNAIVRSMMTGLVLSEGEYLRLRAVIREQFYEDVSVASVEKSYQALEDLRS